MRQARAWAIQGQRVGGVRICSSEQVAGSNCTLWSFGLQVPQELSWSDLGVTPVPQLPSFRPQQMPFLAWPDTLKAKPEIRSWADLIAKMTESPAGPPTFIYRSWVSTKCFHQNQKKRLSSNPNSNPIPKSNVRSLENMLRGRSQLQHTCEVYVLFGLVYSWLPRESEYPGPVVVLAFFPRVLLLATCCDPKLSKKEWPELRFRQNTFSGFHPRLGTASLAAAPDPPPF